MCELSIIVPVYNAEKYIVKTVGQLLTQQGVAFEVILVDDGSKDKSAELCDMLVERDTRVRCFHIENGGPGRARNYGISVANGKYIAFCDSDDLPSENMYGKLCKVMEAHNVDYCMCDIFTERDNRNFGFPWNGNQKFTGAEVVDVLLASMLGNQSDDDTESPVWGSSVRSIYKRELLDKYGVRFPEDIRFAEDLVFNTRYLVHCSAAYVLNQVLYRYTWNSDSLMNSYVTYHENMLQESLKLVQYMREVVIPIDQTGELRSRLETSARCYFHECVGNAARVATEKGVRAAYKEIKGILSVPTVERTYRTLNVYDIKKKLIYGLIQRKCAVLLTAYYVIRLR